jgi:RNA polymerase sigma factor (sigma-70 family)
LSWTDECKIDPQVVAALYLEHADPLRRFVVGVLGDAESAADVLHATFAKLVELGHTVREDAHKSWLFSVAYHEALALRRRRAVEASAAQRIWSQRIAAEGSAEQQNRDGAEERMIRWETVQRVRDAVEQLPPEQREVVRLRMGEQKKFADIAHELQLPLGTVLSRMQLALAKLRKSLEDERT